MEYCVESDVRCAADCGVEVARTIFTGGVTGAEGVLPLLQLAVHRWLAPVGLADKWQSLGHFDSRWESLSWLWRQNAETGAWKECGQSSHEVGESESGFPFPSPCSQSACAMDHPA